MDPTEPHGAPLDPVTRAAAYVLAQSMPTPSRTRRVAALRAVDPLLRGAVSRRIDAALDDARHASGHPDEAHRARLALLELLGEDVPTALHDDVDAAAARVEAARPPGTPGRWSRSLSLVAFVVLLCAAGAAYGFLRPVPYAGLRPETPPRADATRRGGVPLPNEALEQALARSLPAFGADALEAGLSGGDPTQAMAATRDALLSAELHGALPGPVSAALRRLADGYPRYVARELTAAEVTARAVALDHALVEAGLGFRVEPRTASGVVQLLTYEVDEVRAVAGTHAVYAHRLDALNLLESRFGHALDGGDVLVPLDRIEETLVSRILPLLDSPSAATMLPEGVSVGLHPYVGEAEAAIGAPLRRVLPARCGAHVEGLLDALAARREAFARWAQLLGGQGITLRPPRTYRMDLERVQRAGARNPRLRDLERVHERLGEPELVRAFVCIRDLVADDLVRGVVHERTPPAGVGSSLRGVLDPLGERSPTALASDPAVRAARRHLGALAASEVPTIRLGLALLCWTDGTHCSEADQMGAMFAIAELAREAGRPPTASLRGVGVRTLANHVTALAALPPARLAELARATDARLFAAPPPQPATSSPSATITPSASP